MARPPTLTTFFQGPSPPDPFPGPHLSSPSPGSPPPRPPDLATSGHTRRMQGPSRLVLPAGAYLPTRPPRQGRGTLRLTSSDLAVASRTELLAQGWTDWTLRKAVQRGELRRIARGWFASPGADQRVIRPLALGQRPTCVDAARMHGLWTPHDSDEDRLHVYRYEDTVALPRTMTAHHAAGRTWPEPDAVASLLLALEHAIRCRTGETAAVLLESAMERGLLDPAEVQQLLDRTPHRYRSRIGELSTASDSGSETRVARWLRRRGLRVEQQPYVERVGFLDIYAGEIFLEIDGHQHHAGEDAFERDRTRDLTTTRHGLQVLRLSYAQVWRRWEQTQKDILAAMSEVGAFGRRKVEQLRRR